MRKVRRGRDRRRPGRLHRCDPRGAARVQDGVHRRLVARRRQARAGRDLHQRRLHPVEGAAPIVGKLRARGPCVRRSRHRRVRLDHRRQEDAGAQGPCRRAEQRRHPVPVQEKQDRVLPRLRIVRGQGGRPLEAGSRRRQAGRAHCQARHHRHRVEAAGAAGCRHRQRAGARQRRGARDTGRSAQARRRRRRRHRPRDGQRLAPTGCGRDRARGVARVSRHRRHGHRQGSVEALHQAGARRFTPACRSPT